MNNVYFYRNPNDKTTFIDRNVALKELQKRREKVWQYATMKDAEKKLYDDYQYKKKDRYGVFGDGSIRDISKYKKELYTYYDGNNPFLNQGGPIMISTRAIYGKEIDQAYEKTREPPYIKKFPTI